MSLIEIDAGPLPREFGSSLRRTAEVAKLRRSNGATAARRATTAAERCRNIVDVFNWGSGEARFAGVGRRDFSFDEMG